jgi:hypothetical protein
MLISVLGFNAGIYPLYVRFSEIISSIPCQTINNTMINCTVVAHANGPARVMISYNQNDWYLFNGVLYNSSIDVPLTDPSYNFQYIPCGIGYTAPDYKTQCTPCQPGFYKFSAGIYSCIPCANGTYTSLYGSSNCSMCPANTFSPDNATSLYECGCISGYYVNPKSDFTDSAQACIPCPIGAECNGFNTTQPSALPGYWYSTQDNYTFYSCLPSYSCPGGGPENCAVGYTNQLCGQCIKGYYKNSNSCVACSPYAWLFLVICILSIIILVLLFFHIASLRVAHISSISIAASFFQTIAIMSNFDVNWPSSVQGTFKASSITNFNFDFIQPECIFTNINYQTRWIFTTCIPLLFLILFVVLYIIGEIRTFFANKFGHYVTIKYIKFKEVPIFEDTSIKTTILVYFLQIIYFWINSFIWLRNFVVWFFKQGMTRRQMRYFLNRCVNSYMAMISFSFIYVFTSASQILVCTQQPNGQYTLNASPDIICYQGIWYQMLPVTVLLYSFFGLGTLTLFLFVLFRKRYLDQRVKVTNQYYLEVEIKKVGPTTTPPTTEYMKQREKKRLATLWRKDEKLRQSVTNFNQMFQYVFRRFQKRYFYYEFLVLARKLALSVLYVFLEPILVIIFAILIMIFALLVHLYAMPYRMKFHNIIDYIVLMATLLILFHGLLFYINQFPTPWLARFAEVLANIIFYAASFIVIAMIIWDIRTRRIKENQLRKLRRKQLLEEYGAMKETELRALYRKHFPGMWTRMQQISREENNDDDPWVTTQNELAIVINEEKWIEEEWVVMPNPLVEDPEVEQEYENMNKEVEFALPFYLSDDDFSDNDDKPMNSIKELTDDLFGATRIRKKVKLIKKMVAKLLKNL